VFGRERVTSLRPTTLAAPTHVVHVKSLFTSSSIAGVKMITLPSVTVPTSQRAAAKGRGCLYRAHAANDSARTFCSVENIREHSRIDFCPPLHVWTNSLCLDKLAACGPATVLAGRLAAARPINRERDTNIMRQQAYELTHSSKKTRYRQPQPEPISRPRPQPASVRARTRDGTGIWEPPGPPLPPFRPFATYVTGPTSQRAAARGRGWTLAGPGRRQRQTAALIGQLLDSH